MSVKKAFHIMMFCLIACVAIGLFVDTAEAADTGAMDKNSAMKQGVSESLGTKEFDEDQMPGKTEYMIVIASVIGAIAAVKYL